METSIRSADVLAVADARSGFSRLMRDFRLDPDRPAVAVGPHRRPEVVIVPWSRFVELSERPPSGREGVVKSFSSGSSNYSKVLSFVYPSKKHTEFTHPADTYATHVGCL